MDPNEKFNTCAHRSENEEDISSCGGCGAKKTEKGYLCWKLAIEGVIPNHCASCESYSNRHDQVKLNSKNKNSLDPFDI